MKFTKYLCAIGLAQYVAALPAMVPKGEVVTRDAKVTVDATRFVAGGHPAKREAKEDTYIYGYLYPDKRSVDEKREAEAGKETYIYGYIYPDKRDAEAKEDTYIYGYIYPDKRDAEAKDETYIYGYLYPDKRASEE